MIIGQPKKVEELPIFSVNTIKEFEAGMNAQLQGGLPLNMPIAMPFAQLCQMSHTMLAYKNAMADLAALERGEDEDDASFLVRLGALRARAQELLDKKDPSPDAIQPAQGRLLVPK
jgi:hypothetical protein